PSGPAGKNLRGVASSTPAPFTLCSRASSGGSQKPSDETGQQSMDCSGVLDLAILAASDGIDPRLVGRPCTARALGDVQTDAGRSAQCLIPQAALRDGRFTNSIEKLSRLLVGKQFFKGKISKVRHRRL